MITWISFLAVLRIRIRIQPDPKLFGLKVRILLFLPPNYEIFFLKCAKNELIHHDYTHNTWKIQKVKDFDPFVSSY